MRQGQIGEFMAKETGAVWVRAQDRPHVRCFVLPLLPSLVSAQWAGRELVLFLPRTLINLLNEFIPSACVSVYRGTELSKIPFQREP